MSPTTTTQTPAPEPAKKESFGEKLLHGLEKAGEVVGDVALAGAIGVVAVAGEHGDVAVDREQHPEHSEPEHKK